MFRISIHLFCLSLFGTATLWAQAPVLNSAKVEPLQKDYVRTPLLRKYIEDEGLWNPEDWVMIFKVPKGVSYRLHPRVAKAEKIMREVSVSVLHNDEGRVWPGFTMIKVILGGRLRWKLMAMDVNFKFETLEDALYIEHLSP